MKPEKQQEIALVRYAAITPLIAALDENYPNKNAFYLEASEKGILDPEPGYIIMLLLLSKNGILFISST